MVQHVVPSNIHDERPLRTKASDVVEVLLRTDADVDAADGGELGNDLDVGRLIGNEVVGVEVPALLRERLDELGEPGSGLLPPRAEGQCEEESEEQRSTRSHGGAFRWGPRSMLRRYRAIRNPFLALRIP